MGARGGVALVSPLKVTESPCLHPDSVPVDPTANWAYGSAVSVIVHECAFLDMAQTECVNGRCEPVDPSCNKS